MGPLHYVILRHEGTADPHYDLMFESLPGSQLATWRSAQWPIEEATPLTRLKDHRRFYLSFEGEIPGHRGFVLQIAKGTCEVEVGENAVWTLRILTGGPPVTLTFRQIADERWEGAP